MGNRVVYLPAYEAEVEYLEGDGNSFIDTGLKASSELGILAHIQNSKDNRSFPFGGANGMQDKEYGFQMSNGTYSSFRFGNGGTGNILPKLDSTIIYEFNNIDSHNIINVNDIVYQTTFNSFTSDYNFHLFRENRGDVSQGSNNGVRIYDFKIYQDSTLVRDFVPVRIGQVGYLYDKVTKQLFANKGTGQFVLGNDVANATVPQLRHVVYFGGQRCVGFEEGVDYEVHQWLRVEISANAPTSYMRLPLNSSIFEFKRKFDKFGNSPYFSSENYTYVTGTAKKVSIYDKVNGGSIEISNFTLNTGDVVDVVCDGQELYFNNQQFTMYENPWSVIYFRLNSAGSADFSTSKILIDGVDRYIPCKLLRSIPSKYDANGIARQAGECGMYDTVNDKFYGNVASGGTFSVSDD